MLKNYKKFNKDEIFEKGDLVSFFANTELVVRSVNRNYKKPDSLVIGICVQDQEDKVEIQDDGIVDVNVEGLICVGDILTTGDTPGKAVAIKYNDQDVTIFNFKKIGKVINVYNDYNKALVMLNIK